MNRRHFLLSSVAGLGAIVLPFGRNGWLAHAEAARGQPRLVVIFLRGAVDGLSVVVPHGDGDYYRLRRDIALAPPSRPGGVLDLDGHFGLHPALAPLMPFWRDKTLAFVHASGSPDPTRSHFDAQIYMENGTPGLAQVDAGWMNRLLAQLPGAHPATEALAFGASIPRILSGPIQVANVPLGNSAGKPMAVDRPEVAAAFAKLYADDDAMGRTYRDGQISRQKITTDMQSDAMAPADMGANGAPLPNGFPGDAARLAVMMGQDPSIRLAFLALGGWDTHVNQGNAQGQLASHLTPLAQGLAILAHDLGPAFRDTTIVVMSEFGRTVRENGNAGTDHGHGNVLWLMGGAIAGGRVAGTWPGLAEDRLYQQRDLAVTTDFRAVFAPILMRRFALNDAAIANIFPGTFTASQDAAGLVRA